MEFSQICVLFEKLEKTSKRLEKILYLRDFLLENKKESKIIFDILAKNFQRELNKKNIGISIKTIFSVLSFVSRVNEIEIEKKFNKIGDIGKVSEEVLSSNKQHSLSSKNLTLNDITKTFEDVVQISGTNSNKIKKELLSKLFLSANSSLEHRYLARLLIDDLRIGVSEGTLKEAAVAAYFPQIIGINFKCLNGHSNLNLLNCYKCKEKIDQSNQDQLFMKKYQIVELETPKKDSSLLNYDIEYEINTIEYALRRNRTKYVLKTQNSRDLYNIFLDLFERKYNLINSFSKIFKELDQDLSNVLKFEIILGIPIKSMLGTRSNTISQSFEFTKKPSLIDFKYDGLRVQIHNNFGKVNLFSRNLEEITKQFPEVIEFIKENFSDISFVIDSECVGYDFDKGVFLPFQTLSRRILTKEISQVSHIKVVVKAFDILYLNNKTLVEVPYINRRELLENLFINKQLKQKFHFDIKELK